MTTNIQMTLAVAVMFFAACSGRQQQKKQEKIKDSKQRIETALVEKAAFAETVKLPAQLLAYQEVSIYPKVNGYVKTVLVDIGSRVKPGQVLMILEAPELQQQTLQAKEKYARTLSDFAISKERYMRLKQASATEGAVSPLDLAIAKSKMLADSSLGRAEKANWDMQEIMQRYLRVTAPFGGVITERNVHPGALVSAVDKDKPMLELKEIQHLRLTVDVPEAVASTLQIGDEVSFFVSSYPGKAMKATISRMSNNLNMQYRTEKMELDVPNEQRTLASGMYADVVMVSKSAPGALSIPKSALVATDAGSFVLLVRDKKIVREKVTTGIESDNRVQIFGHLSEGERIITNADTDMEDGKTIE